MNSINFKGKSVTPSKVVCVGKNYFAHVREMGGDARPKEPVIFIKPNSAVISDQKIINIPLEHGLLHHEVELCFTVRKKCTNVDKIEARNSIGGFAVGIDLTLRERQNDAKKAQEPWALSKGFDGSAVFGTFLGSERVENPSSLDISLKINGGLKQKANTSQMIFKPEDILSFASRFMTIEEGDIFMCGTPEGVGEIKNGDEIYALIEGLPPLSIKVFRK